MIRVVEAVDLAVPHAIRRRVFVDEQGVSEAEEFDDADAGAVHLVAERRGTALGTARLIVSGATARIGRLAVLPEARGAQVGTALMEDALARLARLPAVTEIRLSAQCHALGFYARHGFTAEGPVYDDAGIPHRDMVRRP